MTTLRTNLRNTRESARQVRVEPTGNITQTNTQKALEQIIALISGGLPGGTSGLIQYNNAGAFGGAAALTYATSGSLLTVAAQAATDKPLIVKAAGSQSANLQEWQDSTAAILASISAAGVVKAADGTVSLPGVAFTADTDSGLYRIGANNLGMAVNAAKVLDVSTTGIGVVGTLLNGNGTVSLPAFSFTSDPDCGGYRIGANNLGVAVNGAKVLDISTTGLGVVGTLLNGDGTVSLPAFAFTADTNSGLYRIGADNIAAAVNGAKALDIGTTFVAVPASYYLNFGATTGTSGYGFRDNAGTIEFKNFGGSWATFGSGGAGSPGGSDTQIQFNSAGSFGGAASLTYASNILTVTSQSATDKPLVVKGAGSQSGNLQEWRDSTAAVLASISAAGVAKVADGTVSLPGVAFTADTDSGLYRIGANNIGIGVNGAKVLDVSTTGLGVVGTLLNGDGTVSLPSLSFTADTNSGFYRIGADNIGAAVNGVKSFDLGTTYLMIPASYYLNWGATSGTSGYGVRDNAGSMEWKNSGGSWASFGGGGSGLPASDGTVLAPGIAFSSDLDTGLYRIGANNIGIAANGAKVVDIGTAGIAVTGTINKVTLTQPATGSTITIADGKTLTVSNTLAFSGTDSASVNVGAGGTVIYAGSQSDQETGTSNSVVVTPGIQKYHLSSVKVWVRFNSAGTIAASYNVSSVTDNAVGAWTVNFTTAFSSASYGISGLDGLGGGAGLPGVLTTDSATAPAAGSCKLNMTDVGGALFDPTPNIISASFFGDQ